jgi:transcriptional regulator with XRE-family HTH domain
VAEANPTVARRRLAVYFQNLRKRHGVGLEELSGVLGVALSQASRLDTGARGLRVEDVEKLSRRYGLATDEQTRLTAFAEEARRRAWWQQYDLAPAFRTVIGMEQAALSISEYAGCVVPGLLQTRDYATAAVAANAIDVSRQVITNAVEVRMRRQAILARKRPPELWVVIDEAVLARVAGGPMVMRQQLEHLYARSQDPGVTVQVIGFEYGLYPGGGNHLILLQMEDDLPDVLYAETVQGQKDTTDITELRTMRRLWDTLRALALSPRDSAARIRWHVDRLSVSESDEKPPQVTVVPAPADGNDPSL